MPIGTPTQRGGDSRAFNTNDIVLPSFTTAAGELVVAFFSCSGNPGGTVDELIGHDGDTEWDQILATEQAGIRHAGSVWVAHSSGSTGTLTIKNATQQSMAVSVWSVTGADVSGTLLNSFKDTDADNDYSEDVTLTLAGDNVSVHGWMIHGNSSNLTPEGTELDSVSYNYNDSQLIVDYAPTGDSTPSFDTSPDDRTWAAFALEIKEASAGVTGTLSETLDDDTSTTSGQVGINVTGTLSETLDGDTSNTTGSVGDTVTGTLSETLDNDTSAADGELAFIQIRTPRSRGFASRSLSSDSITTQTFTPAPNELLVAFITVADSVPNTTLDSITSTLDDGGTPWAFISPFLNLPNNDTVTVIACHTGVSPSAGNLQVHLADVSTMSVAIIGVEGVNVSGDLLDSFGVRQFNFGAASSFSVNSSGTDNPIIGHVAVQGTPTITPDGTLLEDVIAQTGPAGSRVVTMFEGSGIDTLAGSFSFSTPYAVSTLPLAPISEHDPIGYVEETTDNDTSATSGTVTVAGSLLEFLDGDVSAASGIVPISGTLAETLEDNTMDASGVFGDVVIGTSSTTLDSDTVVSSGEQAFVHILAPVLRGSATRDAADSNAITTQTFTPAPNEVLTAFVWIADGVEDSSPSSISGLDVGTPWTTITSDLNSPIDDTMTIFTCHAGENPVPGAVTVTRGTASAMSVLVVGCEGANASGNASFSFLQVTNRSNFSSVFLHNFSTSVINTTLHVWAYDDNSLDLVPITSTLKLLGNVTNDSGNMYASFDGNAKTFLSAGLTASRAHVIGLLEYRPISINAPIAFSNVTVGDDESITSGQVGADVNGELAETLDADTVASSGLVVVSGTVIETMVGDSSAIAATATTIGTSSETLDDDASTIVGQVGLTVTGTLSETLDNDTSVIAAIATVIGVLSETLDDDNSAIAAIATTIGTLSETLDDDTSTTVGQVGLDITGTLSETLDNDTSAIVAIATAIGTLSETLNDDTSTTVGQVGLTVTGTLAETLDDVVSASSGVVGNLVIGGVVVTIADDTSASSGSVTPGGIADITLEDDTSASSGGVSTVGTLAETLDNDASNTSGQVGLSVTGTLAETLDNDTSNTSGQVGLSVTGTVSEVLEDDTSSIEASATVVGTLAEIIEDDLSATSGVIDIVGAALPTLENDVSTISGQVGTNVTGTLVEVLANDISDISAQVGLDVSGALVQTVEGDAMSAVGVLTLPFGENDISFSGSFTFSDVNFSGDL